jgi:hypothetical protein
VDWESEGDPALYVCFLPPCLCVLIVPTQSWMHSSHFLKKKPDSREILDELRCSQDTANTFCLTVLHAQCLLCMQIFSSALMCVAMCAVFSSGLSLSRAFSNWYVKTYKILTEGEKFCQCTSGLKMSDYTSSCSLNVCMVDCSFLPPHF